MTGLGPPGRVHGDNVRVGGQAGDRRRLPAKLPPRPLVLDAATQHLHRDQSVEGLLTGEVHVRRTALAERAQDGVAGQYRTPCAPRLRAGPAVGAEERAGRQIGVALPAHGRRCGICACSPRIVTTPPLDPFMTSLTGLQTGTPPHSGRGPDHPGRHAFGFRARSGTVCCGGSGMASVSATASTPAPSHQGASGWGSRPDRLGT